MKILVLENHPSSRRGGQELSLLDVCRGLAERGHEIHLAYTEEGDLLETYQGFCRSTVRVGRYGIDRGSPLASAREWVASLFRALKVPADVVYFNQYHDALFGAMLARLKRVPLVCHLRLFPPGTFCGQWRIGLKAVTRFVTVSEATRNAYIEVGFAPEILDVVHNGIDLERFSPKDDRDRTRDLLGIAPNEHVVLFAGRLDPGKNLELLIRAFAEVVRTEKRSRLLMIGSPLVHASSEEGKKYVDGLKALGRSLGLADSIQWLGRRGDLPALFRAADVTVLPSRVPETFGRTLAESMACGTPAVAARIGGMPEVLGEEFQNFCFEDDDAVGLASLLQTLRGWSRRTPELGRRCRAHVEDNFSVDRMVAGVEEALERAAATSCIRQGPSGKALCAWGRSRTGSISVAQGSDGHGKTIR